MVSIKGDVVLFAVQHAAPLEVLVLNAQVYKGHFSDTIKNETVG